MFDIEYKGGNTVVVSTKKVSVVFDPKQSVVGLKDFIIKGAVQVATEPRFVVEGDDYRLRIEGPGEYEVADVAIKGIAFGRHLDDETKIPASTVYKLAIGGVRLALFGNIGPKLTEDQMEEIGLVDIAIIPVGGGGYTLDSAGAAAIVRQIEPKAVVPIHYADAKLAYEVPQEELSEFTSDMGAPVEQAGTKYKLKTASALPAVLTTIVVDRS